MKDYLDSTDALNDAPELMRRIRRDGYLFFRKLLPPEPLTDLRLRFLSILRDAGWTRPDRPLEQAVANLEARCVESDPAYNQVQYDRMYRVRAFHLLQHHPALLGLFERMLGAPVLPHPRVIGRTIFPGEDKYATPPHQDYVYIQGTPDTYTAWIPLSDCPAEMGGLAVAAGSHVSGVREDLRLAPGVGGLEVADPLDGTWVYRPYGLGDVVVFHSLTVHKGLSNGTDRLRLSVDYRYQRASEPIVSDSLEPDWKRVTWDQVYAGWEGSEFTYYWRKFDLALEPFDYGYARKLEALVFEMAEAGDQRSRTYLQRIVARDPDPERREQAKRRLTALDAEAR